MFLSNTHSLKRKLPYCYSSSCSQSCTGDDACKNYVWEGNYVQNIIYKISSSKEEIQMVEPA